MNLPNLLTLVRIALIPVLVLLIMLPGAWTYEASAAVFLLASLTDWLDGYLARRLKLQTALGAFLDPVSMTSSSSLRCWSCSRDATATCGSPSRRRSS